jgi:hypothetical protein
MSQPSVQVAWGRCQEEFAASPAMTLMAEAPIYSTVPHARGHSNVNCASRLPWTASKCQKEKGQLLGTQGLLPILMRDKVPNCRENKNKKMSYDCLLEI